MTLVCKATGQPTPTIMWRKAFGHVSKANIVVVGWNMTIVSVTKADSGTYACSVKNLLSEDSAVALVTVIDRLELILAPPPTVVAKERSNILLNCAAHGKKEILWERQSQALPKNHAIFSNGTLLLGMVSPNDAGTYKCVAKNYHRSIETVSVVKVLLSSKLKSCSEIKSRRPRSSSGNYIIDPDGKGGVTPFSVYCDMNDKGGVGVTVISHDSESRTYVNEIPGCNYQGCYRKDVTYSGVTIPQLAALTQVSQKCEQFIKYECNPHSPFIEDGYAWWVSRDGTRKDYWGGATGYSKMCACGITNSCSSGRKCNCPHGGWSEDSGMLKDKSTLPVTQIRLGDLDGSHEKGYHTLGKLKCYGQG